MNNIYVQAFEVQNNVARLTGYSVANYDIVRSQEALLESMAVKAVVYDTIKDIVNSCGLTIKRLATGEISKRTTKVLTSYNASDIQLISLFSFTNEVYDKIKELPTVVAVCGDHTNEADFSVHESSRAKFMNGLAYFVARQILLFKRKLSEILNEKVAKATELWSETYDATKGTFTAIHQAANKLRDGGVSPEETKERIVEIYEMKRKDLADYVRVNFGGGYLAEAVTSVRKKPLSRIRDSVTVHI